MAIEAAPDKLVWTAENTSTGARQRAIIADKPGEPWELVAEENGEWLIYKYGSSFNVEGVEADIESAKARAYIVWSALVVPIN